LAGPTGSGKTEISTRLDSHRVEIVSFDSRQIYKGLEIGTTAPSSEDLKKRPHHLVGFADPDYIPNAKLFSDLAHKAVVGIWNRNNIPLLVAGTGFYLKAFLEGMFPVPEIEESTKRYVNEIPEERVGEELKKIDRESSSKIDPKDFYRIRRALEVGLSGGKWSETQNQREGGLWNLFPKSKGLGLQLVPDRKELYQRINHRAISIQEGMLEETRKVRLQYGENCHGLKSLGYDFALAFLNGKIQSEDFQVLLSQAHRNYAKRQLTWFRKESFLVPSSYESALSVLQRETKR